MTIPGTYSQRDTRWGSQELGYNNEPYYNMYHFGCLVTAIANAMWDAGVNLNPGTVNQWLKDNAGFVQGGGNVIWEAANELMLEADLHYQGYATDLAAVNTFLADERNYAICQLTKPGFPMHFSVAPYIGEIQDSWDAVLKPITSYKFVGAHLYSKVDTLISPPVVTPPATASPTIVAPLPEASPEPVASVETPQEVTPEPVSEAVAVPVTVVPPTPVPVPKVTSVVGMATLGTTAPVTNLTTGQQVVNVPAGTVLSIAGSVMHEGTLYLLTEKMVAAGNSQGIAATYFKSSDGPALSSTPSSWHPILWLLHLIHLK